MKGPDHLASDDPKQFKKYVELIRNNEQILEILKRKNKKKKLKCSKYPEKEFII